MSHPARIAILSGLLAALAGCGGDSTPPTPPREIIGGGPGSRLAARALQGPDGSTVFDGFFDVLRSEPCDARLAADGTQRCLPLGVNFPNEGDVFATSDCAESSRLVTRHTRYVGAKLAVLPDPTSCPTRWHVRELGASVTGSMLLYSHGGPGTPCVSLGMRVGTRYFLAAEVAPSSFVSFAERLGAPHGGLRARDLVATDGAWQQAGEWDEGRGLACSWVRDAGGAWRCVDSNRAGGDGYMADASCSAAAVGARSGQAGCTPTVASSTSVNGCRGRSGLYEVGAALSGAYQLVDSGAGPTCSALPLYSPASRQPFWARGPELPASAFPGGADAPAGVGRLKATAADAGGGPRLTGELLDGELGIRCTADYIVNENVIRCLPTEASTATVLENYFSDSACSMWVAWATGCDARVARFRRGPFVVDGVFYDLYDFYFRLGAPYPGTVYWRSTNGCVPASGPLPDGAPHLLGAVISYADFAPLTYELRTP